MTEFNYSGIFSQIQTQTNKTTKEINQLIKQKNNQYAGLLTKDGLVFAVSKDLKINLIEIDGRYIKITKEAIK